MKSKNEIDNSEVDWLHKISWNTCIRFSELPNVTDLMILKQYELVCLILELFKDPTISHLISLKSALFMLLSIYSQLPVSQKASVDFQPENILSKLRKTAEILKDMDESYSKEKDNIIIQSVVIEITMLINDKKWDRVLEIIEVFYLSYNRTRKQFLP